MNIIEIINYYLNEFSISSPFGEIRGDKIHRGVDLNQPGKEDYGKSIYSLTNGFLKRKGFDNGGGNFVVIGDGSNETKYMHMKEQTTYEYGDHVKIGDVVGFIGSTGQSTGPHLHLERWEQSKAIDPILWMKRLLIDEEQKNMVVFKDVPADAWYAKDAEKAVKFGLMIGVRIEDGKIVFEPDRPPTRAELATVLVRLYEALN